MTILPEEWRPIPGYEHSYAVSSKGRVKSTQRRLVVNGQKKVHILPERILNHKISKRNGYHEVQLSCPYLKSRCRRYRVHILVAAAFLGPRPTGMHILHGPNGKQDNSVENLSYGTPKENALDRARDGTIRSKLSTEQVIEIRTLLNQKDTCTSLAQRYKVSVKAISDIKNGRKWAWLP